MLHEQSFLDYLAREKRYSSHTLTAYQTDLSSFGTFLNECYEVRDEQQVNHAMIRDWIVALLEDQGLSATSVNRKLSAIKSYFRFLKKQGVLTHNPVQRVVAPKKSKRLPEFVDESGMERLFSTVEFEDTFEGARDRLVLDLFYQTGIRLSELIHIGVEDVDLSRGFIRVLGKRNKERLVPFTGEMRTEIEAYLAHRKGLENIEDTAFLFLTAAGKKMYPSLVYKRVNQYLAQVTNIRKKSPHVIRHTFATHMLNRGADLHTIKEILGHANLSATQVYTHNSLEKMKHMYNQAHPRA